MLGNNLKYVSLGTWFAKRNEMKGGGTKTQCREMK